MLKVMRWGLAVLAALVLLVVAVWSVSRLLPLPKAQQEALALLRQTPAVPSAGGNIFDGLWLLASEDVPEAERAAILAEDDARMLRLSAMDINAPISPADSASVAQARYRQVADVDLPCRWRQRDCLTQVRADSAGVESRLAGQRGLLARINALSAGSHYRNRFPADGRQPMPSFMLLQRALSAHALAHVQGRSDEALAGICSDVRSAKVLMSHSDGLVPANLGAAMIGGNVQLLASVLAELPLDQPLPAACDGVFAAPAPQALSLCPAMRGEFAMVSSGLSVAPESWAWLVLDKPKTEALLALPMAGACTQRSAEALVADIPAQWEHTSRSNWRLECAANVMGCIVASISGPAFNDYGLSLQDAGARLRLAEALLWMRANPHADAQAALAQMPARLRDGKRPLRLGKEGASLQVASYHGRDNGMDFAVPLPGSAVAP